jgi:AraC family transcriptional regulator of adaptative response/methylated-DNA-[protein]-cysteine methyltransferase
MVTTTNRSAYTTDSERWQAVLDRDPSADGAFFTCVHTTGIYCRPTCPARKPLRENVHFVASVHDARREGYRACKRCKPDDAADLGERQAATIAMICERIETSEEPLSLDDLAALAGMSRFHFHRVFKQVTGVTPKAYEMAHRSNRVRNGLEKTSTVTQAIYDAGFSSNGRFYASTNDMLGMTPGTFRHGAPGTTIRLAFGESSLGLVLVAATDTGICSITMGDDHEAMKAELRRRFPRASFVEGDAGFEASVGEVVRYIEEPRYGINLPLDVRGTAFQQRVWQALRDIPRGTTMSYSEVASRIGAPGSARAVAAACAQNKIAIAIPCHRVVGKNGSLTGYRWGTERKRELLEREAQS